MKHSHLVGIVEELVTVLNANTAALTAAGVMVKDIATELSAQKDTVVTKTAERDGLQTAAKDKTAEVNQATVALYDTFSSKIDHAVGAVGKKSNLAKQIQKMRTGLHGKGNKAAASASVEAPQSAVAPAALKVA